MKDYAARFQKFSATRQPPLCLQLAMEDFFDPALPEAYREPYGAYLKTRVRALAEKLLERDDPETLAQVEKLGWLTPQLVREFAQLAAKKQKCSTWVWLLERMDAVYGFPTEEFDL